MPTIGNTPRPGYVYDQETDTWIPIGVGPHTHDYVDKTLIDAKGDLLVGSAADTVSKLSVSENGSTLVADSSTSTGLRYNPPVGSLANPVINGGFDIWQRGTSGTNNSASGSGCNADRWTNYLGSGAITVSRQATGDTTNLPNLQYCARVQRNSGNTAVGNFFHINAFESVNSIPFAGKTVTLSFYARAGANFSASSNILTSLLVSGTGTDQNPYAGFTGSTNVAGGNNTLTTTWQRFAWTGTVATNITQLAIQFYYGTTGTAGANDYFEVTGVQIDLGTYTASSAPTFRRSGGTLAGELAACQRYYFRNTADGAYSGLGFGAASSSVDFVAKLVLPVQMRIAPSSVDFSTIRLSDEVSGYAITSVLLNTAVTNKNTATLNMQVASGLTQYRFYTVQANNSTSAYLGVSAEL